MTTAIAPELLSIETQRDALIERILTDITGVWNVYSLYIGDQLGLYARLAEAGPRTSDQLAGDLDLAERYVREWLEQQTVAGILAVENPEDGADRAPLPPAGRPRRGADRRARASTTSRPWPRSSSAPSTRSSAVLDAFRTGGGVPFADYGTDLREGQAGMNRNMFLYQLGQEYLPAIPDLHARLTRRSAGAHRRHRLRPRLVEHRHGPRLPQRRVDGFDLDEASVAAAQRPRRRDAGSPTGSASRSATPATPPWPASTTWSPPSSASTTCPTRSACCARCAAWRASDGTVLVMDERVGERFTPTAATSSASCTASASSTACRSGMADQPSAGTGTVMRPGHLRGYAREAGFADVEILPIENYFFNFYRLVG